MALANQPRKMYCEQARTDGSSAGDSSSVLRAAKHDAPSQPPQDEAHVVRGEGGPVQTGGRCCPQLFPRVRPTHVEANGEECQKERRYAE